MFTFVVLVFGRVILFPPPRGLVLPEVLPAVPATLLLCPLLTFWFGCFGFSISLSRRFDLCELRETLIQFVVPVLFTPVREPLALSCLVCVVGAIVTMLPVLTLAFVALVCLVVALACLATLATCLTALPSLILLVLMLALA
jgi:hypothetical protein